MGRPAVQGPLRGGRDPASWEGEGHGAACQAHKDTAWADSRHFCPQPCGQNSHMVNPALEEPVCPLNRGGPHAADGVWLGPSGQLPDHSAPDGPFPAELGPTPRERHSQVHTVLPRILVLFSGEKGPLVLPWTQPKTTSRLAVLDTAAVASENPRKTCLPPATLAQASHMAGPRFSKGGASSRHGHGVEGVKNWAVTAVVARTREAPLFAGVQVVSRETGIQRDSPYPEPGHSSQAGDPR